MTENEDYNEEELILAADVFQPNRENSKLQK